jgi:23S rRNA U2552 (ribose-2'-O)-methylase RlmE/FtsJ
MDEWDTYKKYTNPYEYIHSHVPHKKKSVAKYKPLSTSYFKMIEIMDLFHIENLTRPINSFHLSEGQGGFIEALAHKRKNTEDHYYSMITADRSNLEISNVHIEPGADKTGNLLSIENLIYCKEKYGSSIDIITADGGCNTGESNICRLLFAEICFALCMQSINGSFILKIFDCFTETTIDLIALLSSFYKRVYITKPNTSSLSDSEKYIVCKGFMYAESTGFYSYILHAFTHMISSPAELCIHRFLHGFDIPYYFMTKIEDYNAIFGQQQIENIHYTLSLMDIKLFSGDKKSPENLAHNTVVPRAGFATKPEKIESIIYENIKKCLYWCVKHNIPHNVVFSQIYTDTRIDD